MRIGKPALALLYGTSCAPQASGPEESSAPSALVTVSAPSTAEPSSAELADTRGVEAEATGVLRFCAHGGPSVLSAGSDPLDFYTSIVVMDLDSRGDAAPVTVTRIDLLDAKGAVLATTKGLSALETLEASPAPGADWAAFMDAPSRPFAGRLDARKTTLRVRAGLVKGPVGLVSKCRVVVRAGRRDVTVEGSSNGEWPT